MVYRRCRPLLCFLVQQINFVFPFDSSLSVAYSYLPYCYIDVPDQTIQILFISIGVVILQATIPLYHYINTSSIDKCDEAKLHCEGY